MRTVVVAGYHYLSTWGVGIFESKNSFSPFLSRACCGGNNPTSSDGRISQIERTNTRRAARLWNLRVSGRPINSTWAKPDVMYTPSNLGPTGKGPKVWVLVTRSHAHACTRISNLTIDDLASTNCIKEIWRFKNCEERISCLRPGVQASISPRGHLIAKPPLLQVVP